MFHAVHQGPANAAAIPCVDKAVLRARVQGIFPVHELRVQHHVALLAPRLDVRQALPVHQILGAGHAGGSRSSGEVSRGRLVLPLHAEDAVNPAVLMPGQAHVVNIGGGLTPLRHGDGTRPEGEVVHAVGTLGHGEEGLAVGPLYTYYQHVFVAPLDGAGVQRGMDADPFHEEGVALLVQVIAPLQRSMFPGKDGILVAFIYTVPFDGSIRAFNQSLVALFEPGKPFLESFHYWSSKIIFSSSAKAFISASFSKPFQAA